MQRVFVLHALDVDGRQAEAVTRYLLDWIDARVGAPDTPARVPALLNWCNLSFPDGADYVRSEAACAQAQRLLELPDLAGQRGQYAYRLALGRGMAIQNQGGRARDALPHLSQALSLATLARSADDTTIALVNLGWAQYQAGDAPAAKRLLERVLRDAPDSGYVLPAILSLGDIACGEGAYDDARRQFEDGRARAVTIEGETSPRRRHFDERLAMLDAADGERCNRP